jgi:uncharacterized membrane protein YfcA
MMIALPVLTFVLDTKTAILLCCIVGVPCCIQLAWLYREHIYWPDIKWLWIGCIPGCIIGTLTLMAVPANWLQLGLSLLICVFLLLQLAGNHSKWTLPDSVASLLITGCAGGFTNATVSIAGVPMGIFVLLKHWDKDKARSAMGIFFLLSNLITIAVQWYSGLYSLHLLQLSSAGAVGCFAGMSLGFKIGKKINQSLFVKIVLIFLAGVAVMLFWKGIQS